MKSPLRIRLVLLLQILSLVLSVVPASASTLYSNGPVKGNVDGWAINFGFTVSDSFLLTSHSTVQGFDFAAWTLAGDEPRSVDWSLTSSANGGTVYESGTANLTTQYLFTNGYGFNVDEESVSGLNLPLTAGGYWLKLQNAVTQQGDPLYWDENSGSGCSSPGCPSLASENSLGTIPSESFNIMGTQAGSSPEPSSLMLVGSGIIGLTGLIRRRRLRD